MTWAGRGFPLLEAAILSLRTGSAALAWAFALAAVTSGQVVARLDGEE
jgi:hypothetical protein